MYQQFTSVVFDSFLASIINVFDYSRRCLYCLSSQIINTVAVCVCFIFSVHHKPNQTAPTDKEVLFQTAPFISNTKFTKMSSNFIQQEMSSSASSNKRLRLSDSSSITPWASTSPSSIQKRFKHDVFISFRGEDTRKNFVDHLYQALKDKGIYTYKDDVKLKKGKRVGDDLLKAIEDSKIYIVVFSENYASSSWCLKELVKIMECEKMPGHTAFPLFYDVEPTEVRKQSRAVGHGFTILENDEVAGKWREALKEATSLAGWELRNTFDGHEAKFIQTVVQEISLELRSINCGFDVFISFRGEDTRRNIVDHLYHALNDKGIYTYKDDVKIQKGKRISDDLLKAIQDSKICIVVFSKNYASSSWCLEELVKIMECEKMPGHTAFPLFYDVEPTQVRKQSGPVGEAFCRHEKNAAAGKWRDALKEAANLAGWELKNTCDGFEAKFIKKVVQDISLKLRSINSGFDEKLGDME